jgi:multiple sugar transport system permease protein
MKRLLQVALTLGLAAVVGPFAWAVISSFKAENEIRQQPPTFLPDIFTTSNYTQLFHDMDVGPAFANSVIVAVITVAANLLFCSMVAYALAKLRFAGGRVVFGLILLQMMVPPIVLMIPQFVIVANAGLLNTIGGIVLPMLVTPVGVFLMRQFIAEIPDDLLQAARVDGAREFRVFFQIVLPLCRPALATLGLITFLASWNNFLWPAVVTSDQDSYTLPVALAFFATGQAPRYGLLLAGAVIVITPVVLLFVALQRHFVQGIATTGLK